MKIYICFKIYDYDCVWASVGDSMIMLDNLLPFGHNSPNHGVFSNEHSLIWLCFVSLVQIGVHSTIPLPSSQAPCLQSRHLLWLAFTLASPRLQFPPGLGAGPAATKATGFHSPCSSPCLAPCSVWAPFHRQCMPWAVSVFSFLLFSYRFCTIHFSVQYRTKRKHNQLR